jgi:hypothetical protein
MAAGFRFVSKWAVLTLPIALVAGAASLCQAQAVAWNHSPAGYRYAYYPPVSAVYVRGGPRAYHYAYRPAYVYPRSVPLGWLDSWPLVAGDIRGYPYLYRVPQPWGQQVIVIGPRSYLVRPLYQMTPRVEPQWSGSPPPVVEPPKAESPEQVPAPPAIEPVPLPANAPAPASPASPAPAKAGPREF